MRKINLFCILVLMMNCGISFSQDNKVLSFELLFENNKYILLISDSIFNRDLIVFTRIESVSGDVVKKGGLKTGPYEGAKTSEEVIRIYKNEADKIFVQLVTYERHSTAHPSSYQSKSLSDKVTNEVELAIIERFSRNKNYKLDISSLLISPNKLFFISEYSNRNLGIISNNKNSDFTIENIKNCASSVEIKSKYRCEKFILNLHTSIALLNLTPMIPRFSDRRLNYFSQLATNFDVHDSLQTSREMITRWNLQVKAVDVEMYKKGLLVEPINPIIFYIDSKTPAKWIPYFIMGVQDWQKAFEFAGYKNAIIGKVAPSENSDTAFFYSKNSVIHYINSDIQDASYSNVIDPRSGEILQSHILWSTGEELNLRNIYFSQGSQSDKLARQIKLDDNIMGELIRRVVSHEIGHALGLNHNHLANNSIPVQKLRNKQWVERNGITYSIMDYARCNYIAQVNDGIELRGMLRNIGIYDKWIINWGYRKLDPYDEEFLLNKWIQEKKSDKRFQCLTDKNQNDPRTTSNALGDDPIKAGDYGIKNLKFIINNFVSWTKEINERNEIKILYNELVEKFTDYLMHAAVYIGGVYESYNNKGELLYKDVSLCLQRRAIKFLNKHIFVNPNWLFPEEIIHLTGSEMSVLINNIQNKIISKIVSPKVIGSILNGSKKENSLSDHYIFKKLTNYIIKTPNKLKTLTNNQKQLQENYINALIQVANYGFELAKIRFALVDEQMELITSSSRKELLQIKKSIQGVITNAFDMKLREHYQQLYSIIENSVR